MILETGVVVAVESDGLWVETIQKSACEVCVAEKGCGQKFLSKLAGKTVSIRVLRNKMSTEQYSVGQSVTIGIPEDVIVMASLLVYLLPIFAAIGGAWLFSGSDLQAVAGALGGLVLGGLVVNLHSVRKRDDVRFNPVLIEEQVQPSTLNFQH
ncbi:SoxR reducing system RseC family protein [Porticoccaceae bacterium]|nr:SoxR reducing system RseC family protein [Porticoccaceae bacterium]MDB9706917.1 SoxR reducing system RseC family protein [Porticoccaceae bacterium]MDB9948888.1 SoxR reducing system RseC family protein [Porticoccaceae bacterium]MDB9992937.1 SoxR reducing system RseC family protein [Porticoccaceae bacterium]